MLKKMKEKKKLKKKLKMITRNDIRLRLALLLTSWQNSKLFYFSFLFLLAWFLFFTDNYICIGDKICFLINWNMKQEKIKSNIT